jgi:hypothetical protein
MKPLNLPEALELYEIIGKHIPEEIDEEILSFVGKIVSSANKMGQGDYASSVILMTKQSAEELNEQPIEEILGTFMIGLTENKILQLQTFCNSIGLNYG